MKKNDRVFTPDGAGIIIDDTSALYVIKLDTGELHFYAEAELRKEAGKCVPIM